MFNYLNEIMNPKGTPLEYEKYKQYEVACKEKGHWIFCFENNYGASVIKHYGSYGYEKDKFELAVLLFDDKGNSSISYNTPITDDVIGWLSNDEVLQLLEKIKNLED